MPRPGFYNDNEYRAYPFVFKPGEVELPTSAVVDAGVIMRLDSNFDDTVHSVWLSSITRISGEFRFELKTDATPAPVVFSRGVGAHEWQIEYAESSVSAGCVDVEDPVWEAFLVTGPLQSLNELIPSDTTLTFEKNKYQLEPARIQNLTKSYLRTVSIGNYERVTVPECGDNNASAVFTPDIILNKACMAGDIRFKEGYKCRITQPNFANEIHITASVNSGQGVDAELCAHGSEIALFPNELLPADSKFFSGGPTCDELIFTVNGLNGPTVTIAGGAGVRVSTQTNPPKITVSRPVTGGTGCE